nr:hypothetical protein [Tanacetum cinerariifolium]
MTPVGRLVLKEKVFRWIKEGMIRKVRHPVWVANTIPVKLANGTWKVKGRNPNTGLLCKLTTTRNGNMLHPNRKDVKWAAEIRTYDISYIPRRVAEGSVVKKFFGQGDQVEETPDANEGGTLNLSRKLQVKSTPTPRAWRFYLGRETSEEGSGVGIILVSPEEKMYPYTIRLKFNASNHAMDSEALLAGLAIYVSNGMKYLHVFMDLPKLVAQTEGNHMPTMKQERKYKKEIIDATTPFHRFRITHLPNNLNSKEEVLT